MDKRTRVLNAMNNQPTDRPPVGFWFHFLAAEGMGDACVQAHLNYYNKIDVDMAKIMCDGYFNYPVSKEIKTPADWMNLKPLGKEHPFIQEQIERAKNVKNGIKEDICVFYNVFAPFSSIRFGTSDEFVMESLKENPQAVLHALDVIAQDNALLSELLITEAHVDGIYYCVQGGEKDRFTYEQYRALITPSDLAVLDHANKFSKHNILHCCGWAGLPNRLEVWKDYPAEVFNWAVFVENMGLTDGKAFFGGKAVLGGFDNRKDSTLFSGSKDDVELFTKELLLENKIPGMLIGADCTLPADIEKNRIEWVVDAVAATVTK